MRDLANILKSIIIKTVEANIVYTTINGFNGTELTKVFIKDNNKNIDFLIDGSQILHGYIEAEFFRRPYNPFKHHSHRSYGRALRYKVSPYT